MVLNSPQDCDSKRIIAVKVYQPKLAIKGRSKRQILRWYHVVFWTALLLQAMVMLTTMGDPYHEFLAKADREGFQVMQGATQRRAQFEYAFKDLNDPGRRTKRIGWMDWQDMDIEELVAEKKRDREQSVLDSLPRNMRVPSRYSCGFWPTFFLGILLTLYALVVLLQYWRVDIDVWLNYREMNPDQHEIPPSLLEVDVEHDMEEQAKRKQQAKEAAHFLLDRKLDNLPPNLPTCARITPAKGPEILVELEYYPTLGMTFEYHRRRYVYRSTASAGGRAPCWSKIRCQTAFSLDILKTWKGFPSPLQLIGGQIRHGPNMFTVKQPSFAELYEKQLLNPFSVFQMFCVLLWAIDDYILYSLFNLFMVFTFEAMVVFQRIQSMKALRGMGNPSRNICVYRSHTWTICDSTELLPGDIMSLKRVAPHRPKDASKPNAAKIQDEGGDVVPADLLLLRGSTVVNEASLTGESIPQMKEGLLDLSEGERLEMKTKHKMNVVYAGTKMLQCKGAAELDADSAVSCLYNQIPNPPDDGCVCFVLRTGFASAQGKLVRMIEGSHDKVKGHERETGLLLMFLFCFAVMSSSYVLYHGMQNDKRSKYDLLLRCILIVTNVIRPELPMQMALAVNNALMTLMKMHIFCTEPFRVPLAGKLDVCLFDKTGTLTTDELIAGGVCEPAKLNVPAGKEDDDIHFLTPMTKLCGEAALVLAGCHSLVIADAETTGDPLEKASLSAMRWQLSLSNGHATPSPATDKQPGGNHIVLASSASNVADVDILTRHHFSSKLQRMSCVIKASGKKFSVAKGSPEAIGELLAAKPAGYDEKAAFLAKQGYRVISLAWKPLASESIAQKAMETRAACEEELTFAGFIAFTCMVRKDTANVLGRLKEGGMTCAMVTGDALLTAIHVAREVEICEPINKHAKDEELPDNEELKALLLAKRGPSAITPMKDERKIFREVLYLDTDDQGGMFWARYEDNSRAEDFVASSIPSLSSRYDLATTGSNLALAYEYDPIIMVMLEHIKVFARMTPDAKEKVIECIHSIGKLTMMCGDGANDVGALKASSVGVALLSGFGNLNVQKDGDEKKSEEKRDDGVRSIMSQEHLNEVRALPVTLLKMKIRSLGCEPNNFPELKEKEDLVQLYQIKARELAVKRHDKKNQEDAKKMTVAEQRAEYAQKMQEKQAAMQRRIEELEAQGVSWAQFKVMKEFMASEWKDNKQKAVGSGGVEGQAAMLASKLDDIGSSDMPMIKLGDASVAAPFTSKMPSIRNCVDIVRQGRCTLVNSLQMYQIMALECLISSYSLSVLYLDGVKYGDTQMTAMGVLGSISFMSVSRSRPLDRLSAVRPLTSIFHPAKFFSLLGQFAIHLGVMLFAVHSAKKHLPPDYEPDPDGTFQPGILNTCVFLVSSVQQVTVFVVNLQGRPFMTSLSENRPLLWSLLGTFILTFMFASETVPGLNRYFQLVPFPDDTFRNFLLILLVMDLMATMAVDRLMQFLFSRDILMASIKETSWKDIVGIFRTFVVIAVIMHVFLGNSEQWDQLLEMENNITDAMMENATEGIATCVGEACNAMNETIAAFGSSEL